MSTTGRRTVIGGSSLRVLHLSDLHFSHHASALSSDSKHCPQLIRQLAAIVPSISHDLVIVSGDLSDYGDRESLLRVRDFLFADYAVSGSERVGLKLQEDRVRIIPGNHDAFNMPRQGSALKRVQKSLENYNEVFPDCLGASDRCKYEWIECDGWNAYLALADSCFLGDAELERTKPGLPYLETTAKGDLVESQVKQLLAWSDRGRASKLEVADKTSVRMIPEAKFIASLKILLMHHYLCEPTGCEREWKLEFMDSRNVFRNILLADFDMLWCGHKHIVDFSQHTYGWHMKPYGKNRYIFNCLRRSIGLASMRMPDRLPQSHTMIPRFGRFLLSLFVGDPQVRDGGNRSAISLIGLALADERKFRQRMIDVLAAQRGEVFYPDREEVEDILQHIESQLSKSDRQQLWYVLKNTTRRITRSFSKRPFIQVLSGSATKRPKRSDRPRCFFLHTIGCTAGAYKITLERFEWDETTKVFMRCEPSIRQIPMSRFSFIANAISR